MKKTCVLLVLFFLLLTYLGLEAESLSYPVMPNSEQLVRGYCSRVVDGDTAYFEIVENGIPVAHSYRFIGVDAPETVHPDMLVQPHGVDASDFTKEMLQNQWVYIEYDIQQTDRYSRHLCYVWLEDGTLFNMTLLEQGYGKFLVYPPNVKYSGFLVAAQKAAKQSLLGIWALITAEELAIDLTNITTEGLLSLQVRIEEELKVRSVVVE